MPDRRYRFLRLRDRWLALASYVALAVLVVGPAILNPGQVAGSGVDLPGTIWMHWWVRTTFEAGSLPIHSDLLFYPDGKNFFNDTGANFIDAYLSVPLQWIFGVPDFVDALDVVVLVGNGLAMHALATDLTGGRSPMAAWAASAAFTINPYAIQQVAEGRPTQALLWFGILATRHLLRIAEGSWRDGLWFGLFTVLQGLTYWFMVYFLTLALLPVALVAIAHAPRVVLPRLGLAVGVAVLIASPFLLTIAGEIDAGNVQRLGFASWREGPAAMPYRWQIARDELLTSASLASLALLVYAGRRALPWMVGVAMLVVFALGARAGFTDPAWENPFFITLWEHVPLLPRLGFPERSMSMAFVLIAMGAAVGLARLDVVWSSLFAMVVVGEALWRGMIPVPATGYDIPDGNVVIRDEGGPVIYLPFGASEDAMVFQTMHGQPLFGGMGEREQDLRPPGYRARLQNGFVVMLAASLNDVEAPIAYTRAEREEISGLFRWVWLDRRFNPPSWTALGYDRASKYARLVKELGEPRSADENHALWDLRGPVPANAPGLGPTASRTGHELERLESAMLAPSQPGTNQPAPAVK